MSTGMVIIGAGHAAVRAALAIRNNDYTGSITMIASEGVDLPYERPPLSKWASDSADISKPIATREQLDSAQIERIKAPVSTVDRAAKRVTLADSTNYPYTKLLLATGAKARRLPSSLNIQSPVHYLRNVDDAMSIKQAAQSAKTALIIGGGFIGLELAASLRSAGVNVQIVEASKRLLERAVSAPVAQIVNDLHLSRGVHLFFKASVCDIDNAGFVTLACSSTLHADLIIAGIGCEPETELAAHAGLNVSNGILVDSFLRTSDPDIFAAGDCCAFPLYTASGPITRLESWQAAGDQGALAGGNMLAEALSAYTNVPWFWSEQYDHVLQAAGLPTTDMTYIERSYGDTHAVSFGINRDGSLGYACGISPGLKIAKDIRFAMKLIEARTTVSEGALVDTSVTLKSLL